MQSSIVLGLVALQKGLGMFLRELETVLGIFVTGTR